MSVLLELSLACGQKWQFAVHFPRLYVIKYAVEGLQSVLPSASPSVMAEPREIRVFAGNSAFVL
jgi:hypothetical protein